MKIRKIVALLVLCLSGICSFQVKAEENLKFLGIDITGPNYDELISELERRGCQLEASIDKACQYYGLITEDCYGRISVYRFDASDGISAVDVEYEEMPLDEVSEQYTYRFREAMYDYPDYDLIVFLSEEGREQHGLYGGTRGSILFEVVERDAYNAVLRIRYSYLKNRIVELGINKEYIGYIRVPVIPALEFVFSI